MGVDAKATGSYADLSEADVVLYRRLNEARDFSALMLKVEDFLIQCGLRGVPVDLGVEAVPLVARGKGALGTELVPGVEQRVGGSKKRRERPTEVRAPTSSRPMTRMQSRLLEGRGSQPQLPRGQYESPFESKWGLYPSSRPSTSSADAREFFLRGRPPAEDAVLRDLDTPAVFNQAITHASGTGFLVAEAYERASHAFLERDQLRARVNELEEAQKEVELSRQPGLVRAKKSVDDLKAAKEETNKVVARATAAEERAAAAEAKTREVEVRLQKAEDKALQEGLRSGHLTLSERVDVVREFKGSVDGRKWIEEEVGPI